jgi:hypothetical protein
MIGITSFSQEGYEVCGRKMLQSVIDCWPGKIIAYHEGVIPDLQHDKIEYRNLFDLGNIVSFLSFIKHDPRARGLINGQYDYNFDCWKFCRKVFAQHDVLKDKPGKVFWLDADVVFKKPIPKEFLDDLFKGSTLIYLGRNGFYSETGVIGFDTEADGFDKFLEAYINVYRTGQIFKLRRWHDCEAFDFAREMSQVRAENLSAFYPERISALHVLPHTVLNEYMSHNKGNRKYR